MDRDCDFCDRRHREEEKLRQAENEIIRVRFESNDKALLLASSEAKNQYAHLNQLRQTMLTKEVYESQHRMVIDRLERVEKLVWIGLGVAYATMFLLKYAAK